jgi:hypothetical protein
MPVVPANVTQAVLARARAIDAEPTEETIEMVFDEGLTNVVELEDLVRLHGYSNIMRELFAALTKGA